LDRAKSHRDRFGLYFIASKDLQWGKLLKLRCKLTYFVSEKAFNISRKTADLIARKAKYLKTYIMKILIADDSMTIRVKVAKLLKRAGYEVVVVDDGDKALLELNFANPQFDLLITDEQMPSMTGRELCRKIRSSPGLFSLPVICLTSLTDEESMAAIYGAGVSDYIRKPFIDEELISRVKVQVERFSLLRDLEIRVRQRTEELSVALDKVKAAAETKNRFLANMSHEMRTPLNGIIGFVDLLVEEAVNYDTKEKLSLIKSSASSLSSIINDILDFSQIEAGSLNLEKRIFNLKKSLQDVVEFFAVQIKSGNKKLVTDFAENLPEELIGDSLRVRQILINLIGNAIKFTPAGGTITVGCDLFDKDPSQVTIRFTVADTGIGMSEEQMSRLFKPFSQADISNTRKYGGTGLGLSITSQLVSLMEGLITLQSEEHVGTTFDFMIPFASPKSKEAFANQGSSTETQRAFKILVVEDNKINQKLIVSILEKNGMQVSIADNGQEALGLIPNEAFDMVLMDCQMPVLDGYEAAKAIRSNPDPKINKLPIIAVTANAMDSDLMKCKESQIDDVVSKPINKDLLFKTMEKYLGS
jgi:signal transduction histidine kinase